MLLKTCAILLFVVGASALHENVVTGVLEEVVKDLDKSNTNIADFYYTFKQQLGPLTTTFNIFLTSGKLVVTDIKLNGDVEYSVPVREGAANFKFTSELRVFLAYRYSVSGGGSTISHGTLSANWRSPMRINMDVESTGCTLKLNDFSRETKIFDVDVLPQDGIFFPVTLHFPPGDLLEKHLEAALQGALTKSINTRKICDCISCYGS